jgi:RNA polymerase sigma-70 factor (ECF subfamily)
LLKSTEEITALASLRAGEPAAQEAFVRSTIGHAVATAQRILGERQEAEDAVQEAYIAAFEKLDSYDGRASLETWFRKIVVNAALMRLRKRKSRSEISIDSFLPSFEDGAYVENPIQIPDLNSSPETVTMLRKDLLRAISILPEEYRTMLILNDIEGYDAKESAEQLHISHQAARQRLHRARQALVKLVGQEYQGGNHEL